MSRNGARPKANRQKRTHGFYRSNPEENRISELIKNLAAFEDFNSRILPALQADIKNGMTPKELREKYLSIVTGRVITDALMTDDAGKAAAIARDLADRVEGKATEKKEVTHKFADMKDEELDAILKSEIDELEDMEQRFEQ